jgi:ubiquinone/menaquinone biosynthesis C-methylase UbiE
MPGKKDTSWNNVAKWYDSLLSMDGTYQKEVILPNLIRLLEIKKGEKVLDIACGQGFFSREIAKLGGEVTGADIAPELIKFAKEKAGPRENYLVIPADRLAENIPANTFDKAVCVLALQNIENLNGTLHEVARILREGGKFFIVLNHPAFRNPKNTSWGFDDQAKIQYRRVDSYLSESSSEIDMNPGAKSESEKQKTVSFHRPLQIYTKSLVKNGFLIGRIEEWNSHKKSEFGPRQKAEDKARKEIPLFMLIEAVKGA